MKAEEPRSGLAASAPAPPSGLILFAMREERDPFLARVRRAGWPLRRRSGSAGRRHDLEAPGLLAEVRLTGPGEVNLNEVLAQVERPEILIHPGFAGALQAGIERGNVFRIAATRCGDGLTEVAPSPLAGRLPHLDQARIVSVDAPADRETKSRMAAARVAELVDMESAPAHAFCRARGIPYLGLRAVSDRVDDALPRALVRSWDGRRFRIGGLVARALIDPRLLRSLLDLRRASQCAAEALAAELMRLLGD